MVRRLDISLWWSALIGVLLLFVLPATAQDFKLEASAKREVAVGERFQVVFSLNGSGKKFQPPSFEGFSVLSGPNHSSSMQIINGNVSQSVSYSYILIAGKEGSYTINPAKVVAGGKEIQSNPVTVKVVKGAASSSGNGSRGNNSNGGSADDLFVKVILSRTKVYQGEAILATAKIYSRYSLVQFESVDFPQFTGFWAEDVDQGTQINLSNEVINGVQYQTGIIKQTLLYPQKSGKIKIDPMEVEVVVRQKAQGNPYSLFDQFFGNYQDVKMKAKSVPTTVEVTPLPAKDKPEKFSGLTGNFNYSVELTKTEIEANEAVNLKIKVSGDGNLKLLNMPDMEFPPDIEAYDPKTSDNTKVTTAGISGSKTYDYVLIPRHAGEFEIGPFSFNYFDPKKGKYVVIEKPAFVLKVGKGVSSSDPNQTTTSAIVNKEDLKVVGKDIRYIKTGEAKLEQRGSYFYRSNLFYALVIVPLLLFIGFVFYHNYRLKQMGNVAMVKSRKATKEAKKRLALASKLLKENKTTEYYEEVFKALWGYMSDKLHMPVSDLSKDNLRAKLTGRGVEEAVIEKYIALIDRAEFARFAPSGGAQEMGNVYDEAIELISKVEDRA